MHGDTTKTFLEYLRENGPQTRKQLEKLPFWGGVRSRVCQIIKQGRIEKILIANHLSEKKHARCAVVAYKFVEGSTTGTLYKGNPGRKTEETYKERMARERKERAIYNAIKLLENQGYKILSPDKKDTILDALRQNHDNKT